MTSTTETLTAGEIAKRFRNNQDTITASGMKITNVEEFGRARGFVAYYVEGTQGMWHNDEFIADPAAHWGLTYDEGYTPNTKTRHEANDSFEVRS